MSRSRKKTPIGGITTVESDGDWKAMAARRLRHRVKQHLNATGDGDRFPGKRWDVVEPWGAPKDGKKWFGNRWPESMRK
jgi:hypothetical protein